MIRTLLRQLSIRYPSYGFKLLFSLIRAMGHPWNHKRVHRIYCVLKLNLKRKPKKRLASRTAKVLTIPTQPNQVWSIDFMSDALACGRRFRTMNVIDDHRRRCLGIKIAFSLPATAVTQHLDDIATRHHYPRMIRLDNGPEHLAIHFKRWAKSHDIQLLYIQPGKPAQNAYIERFNRTYREAILDMYSFDSLLEVKLLTKEWIQHYNYERPHQALGMQTPVLDASRNLNNLNSTLLLG